MTITGFAALISVVVALTEAEMKWSSQGALALPGLEQVNLIGDPNKRGPYTLRLKFRLASRSVHTPILILAR